MNMDQLLKAHGIGAGGKADVEKADEITYTYTAAANSGPINIGTMVDMVNGSQVRDSVVTGDGIITPLATLVGQTSAQSYRDSDQVRLRELAPNKWLMSYYDSGGANLVTLVVLQEINGTLSWGTPFAVTGATSNNQYALDMVTDTQGLLLCPSSVTSGAIRAQEFFVNGTTITLGRSNDSAVQTNNQDRPKSLVHMGDGFFIYTSTGGTYSYGYFGYLSMTAEGFTWGTLSTFSSEQGTSLSHLYKLNSTDCALLYSTNVNTVGETFALLIIPVDWQQRKPGNSYRLNLMTAGLSRGAIDLHPIDDATLLIISASMYSSNGLDARLVYVTRDDQGKVTGATQGPIRNFTSDGGYGCKIVPYSSTRFELLLATGSQGTVKSYAVSVLKDGTFLADPAITLSGVSATSTVTGARSGSGHIVVFGDSTDTYKIKGLVKRITNVVGFAMNAATPGQPVKVKLRGFVKNLSGLQPNRTYYANGNGSLTTTISGTKIGVAISPTELLIRNAFWER